MLLDPDARADERLVIAERLERMGIEVSKGKSLNPNDTTIRAQAFYDASEIIRGTAGRKHGPCVRQDCYQQEFHG